MQRGIVDGVPLNLLYIWDLKLFEVAKYIADPGIIEFKAFLWFNKKK